jgi:hypothetical protein
MIVEIPPYKLPPALWVKRNDRPKIIQAFDILSKRKRTK